MNESSLIDRLGAYASEHDVPGTSIGVFRRGVEVTAAVGVTDVTTGAPVTAQTRFSAGSLTKSMVATVVARLADGGRLSLDAPIATVVPDVSHCLWARAVTIRDLLANRSRLPLTMALEFGFDEHTELSGLMDHLPTGPGTADFWSYSNVGWCLLGRAIEEVTATPWAMAMRLWLSELSETDFEGDGPRACGHDGRMPVPALTSRAYAPAGTTTVTTVADLLRLAALHMADVRLGHLRETHATTRIAGWLDGWCLGWARFDWPGGPVWGWDGLVSGERSVLRFEPESGAAVALMTNSSNGRALYRSVFPPVWSEFFGVRMPAAARLRPVPNLDRYAGVYVWPDRLVEVSATATGLVIRDDGHAYPAVPLDERTFLIDPSDPDNPTVTFDEFDRSGRPHVIYVMLWGLPRQE